MLVSEFPTTITNLRRVGILSVSPAVSTMLGTWKALTKYLLNKYLWFLGSALGPTSISPVTHRRGEKDEHRQEGNWMGEGLKTMG